MATTPEQMEQLYADFSPVKKSPLALRQEELLEKLSIEVLECLKKIESLEKELSLTRDILCYRKAAIQYLKRRLCPPDIKNTLNLQPGNCFSADDYYGICIVRVTGIVQKFSCGLWHELYEYTSTCKSHDGLDTHVTFGQASSVSDITARYFLLTFSKEF